jgi:hypothetical protein
LDPDNDCKDDAGGTIFFSWDLGLGELVCRVLGVVSGVGCGLGRWLSPTLPTAEVRVGV